MRRGTLPAAGQQPAAHRRSAEEAARRGQQPQYASVASTSTLRVLMEATEAYWVIAKQNKAAYAPCGCQELLGAPSCLFCRLRRAAGCFPAAGSVLLRLIRIRALLPLVELLEELLAARLCCRSCTEVRLWQTCCCLIPSLRKCGTHRRPFHSKARPLVVLSWRLARYGPPPAQLLAPVAAVPRSDLSWRGARRMQPWFRFGKDLASSAVPRLPARRLA